MSSVSPYKIHDKKDKDLEYFDNYIMGGTSKQRKMHKSQKHKHELLSVNDPNKIEYN
jgi:hypothetical protein